MSPLAAEMLIHICRRSRLPLLYADFSAAIAAIPLMLMSLLRRCYAAHATLTLRRSRLRAMIRYAYAMFRLHAA